MSDYEAVQPFVVAQLHFWGDSCRLLVFFSSSWFAQKISIWVSLDAQQNLVSRANLIWKKKPYIIEKTGEFCVCVWLVACLCVCKELFFFARRKNWSISSLAFIYLRDENSCFPMHFEKKKCTYNILFILFPLIFKRMTNFQNGLEWPHFTSRTSGTSHSTGFCLVLNLKTEKKNSRNFQPFRIWACFYAKNRKKTFCSQTSPDSMGWKFRNDFVFVLKLSTGQKPIECDVPRFWE